MRIFGVASLVLSIVVFVACVACGQSPEIVVTGHDRIPIYGSQVADRASAFTPSADETVEIPAGESVKLTADESAIDVIVRGRLEITGGAELRVRTLTVVGMEAELALTGAATITFRDFEIATDFDPSQHGHGLLVIDGHLTVTTDSHRQAWATVADELHAGDTKITFGEPPHGWQPGDTLVVPDTRQPTGSDEISAHTETATIAAVDGSTVTLTAPLAHDHLGWHAQDGTLQERFDVGCLSQPIELRSENPDGVRGHVLLARHAVVDVSGILITEMGRTTTEPLHSTLTDSQGNIAQIGRNQIARYPWHHHHLLGRPNFSEPWQFRIQHYAINGSPKWGISIHGSHYGRVANGCVYDCAGSAIVTEDPTVYGNQIVNNMLVAKRAGSGQRITSRSGRNEVGGDHWHDRGGLGLASAANEITGNRIYCCKESIGMAGLRTGSFPLVRGQHVVYGHSSGSFNSRLNDGEPMWFGWGPRNSGLTDSYAWLFDTSSNRIWGGWRGVETWTANSFPQDALVYPDEFPYSMWDDLPTRLRMFPGLTVIHTHEPTDFEDQRNTSLYVWRVLGDFALAERPEGNASDATYAVDLKGAYRFGVSFHDCEFRGHDAAYRYVFDGEYTRWTNCVFECPTILYHPLGRHISFAGPSVTTLSGCEFLPVDGELLFMDGHYPKYDLSLWLGINDTQRFSLGNVSYHLRPWRDGRDLDVFHYEQHPDWEHRPLADPTQSYADWPPGVHTQRELIARGTPIFGDAVPGHAFQSPEFGVFWAADVGTVVEPEPLTLEQRVERLERKVFGDGN